MKRAILLVAALTLTLSINNAFAHDDISPFFQDGHLLVGGMDHEGNQSAPPVTVFGYDFGEDEFDPFNLTDPGVNQAAGVGDLPVGAAIGYNLLSGLQYWNGSGAPQFTAPTGSTYMDLLMDSTSRTLTGGSGAQSGSLIQYVGTGGWMHKHFVTSLFSAPGVSNVPGEFDYVAPATGVYVYSMELTLTTGGTTYISDPLWIVLNNGLTEEQHDAAMDALMLHPGDATKDGKVTDADYTVWADHYRLNFGAKSCTWDMGDFNVDGEVTDADYTVWADNYGFGVTAVVVPEPASLALLSLGVLGLMKSRRQR